MTSFRSLAFALATTLAGFVVGCGEASPEPSTGTEQTAPQTDNPDTSNPNPPQTDNPDTSNPNPPQTDNPNTPAPSKKANGAQCKESADCTSDFCVFKSGSSGLGMCTTTCDGDIDCDLHWKCVKLNNALQQVCIPE